MLLSLNRTAGFKLFWKEFKCGGGKNVLHSLEHFHMIAVEYKCLIRTMSFARVDSWWSLTCTAGGTLTSQPKVRRHYQTVCFVCNT